MRLPAVVLMTIALASCATGPSVGSIEDFQWAAAGAISEDVPPEKIKIHNRRALLFTSYWTAVTPDGARYECSRDLSEDRCTAQKR